MQNEYEAKFLNIDIDQLKTKLTSAGAEIVKSRHLSSRQIFENDLTKNSHAWVRLRDEADKVTLTLKRVMDETSIEGTQEIEFTVSDMSAAKGFLEAIGLKLVRSQQNYREEWRLGDVVFDLDEWPQLEPYVEIEGESEAAVRAAAEKLGFDWAEARFGSVDAIYKQVKNRDILAENELLF